MTYIPQDATLTALAAYNTNGLLTQTAADTFAGRTITGTANRVTVTNGDGVSGNPTLTAPQDIHTAATPTFGGLTITNATRPTLVVDTSGTTAKGRILAATAQFMGMAQNVSFDGTNWNLDDTAKDGWVNAQSTGAASDWYVSQFTAGANPRTHNFRLYISGTGNVKVAGTATRATTEGTNHMDIFNGTAPVGTLANGVSLYSTAGELRVMDAGGTATLLSSHSKETGEWIHDSYSTVQKKRLIVKIEQLCKFVDEKFGTKFVEEIFDKE